MGNTSRGSDKPGRASLEKALSIEEVHDRDLGSWKLLEVIARYSRRTPVDRNLNVWPITMHYRCPSKAIVVEGGFSRNSEFLTLYSKSKTESNLTLSRLSKPESYRQF
ncbi:hypothetical protein CR513_21644, partial [Mucuna pruriens]